MSDARKFPPAPDRPDPPGAWPAARATAKRLISPLERFLSIEASSGILLLVAALAALVWANSPWRSAYENLLHAPLGFRVGRFAFERNVDFLVDDVLMVVFFFVVGLEIKREVRAGELSELRKAALPAFAALGGMLVPAGIYLLFNAGTAAVGGWGIPMATDIAFAVGILALLGKRVPAPLRILLLALAVIDDLGAIVVIAIFYSSRHRRCWARGRGRRRPADLPHAEARRPLAVGVHPAGHRDLGRDATWAASTRRSRASSSVSAHRSGPGPSGRPSRPANGCNVPSTAGSLRDHAGVRARERRRQPRCCPPLGRRGDGAHRRGRRPRGGQAGRDHGGVVAGGARRAGGAARGRALVRRPRRGAGRRHRFHDGAVHRDPRVSSGAR